MPKSNLGSLLTCWWSRQAAYEGITDQRCRAQANRAVVAHLTLGSLATDTGTRINALAIDTRSVCGAFSTRGAFGAAIGWCTLVLGQAGAHSLTLQLATLRIGATG